MFVWTSSGHPPPLFFFFFRWNQIENVCAVFNRDGILIQIYKRNLGDQDLDQHLRYNLRRPGECVKFDSKLTSFSHRVGLSTWHPKYQTFMSKFSNPLVRNTNILTPWYSRLIISSNPMQNRAVKDGTLFTGSRENPWCSPFWGFLAANPWTMTSVATNSSQVNYSAGQSLQPFLGQMKSVEHLQTFYALKQQAAVSEYHKIR